MTQFFSFQKTALFSPKLQASTRKAKTLLTNGHLALALSIAYLFFLNNTVNL